jgi:DNA-binding CsgD family transcriptional regulator
MQSSDVCQRSWPLTSRETEVLAEMASGKTNAAIAQVLFISRRSVEKHVNSIFSKLLLPGRDEHHPRVQAVLMFLAHSQPLAATARGSATESRRAGSRSRPSSPRAHRCLATRRAVMPA